MSSGGRRWVVAMFVMNALALLIGGGVVASRWPEPGGLHVVRWIPSEEVDPERLRSVEVEFGAPVDPSTLGETGIRLDPPVPGTARLEGDRRLVFEFAEPLRNATRYQIRISPSLRGRRGEVPGDRLLEFTTRPLRVLSVSQVRIEADRSAVLEIAFNQPVDPRDVARVLKIEGGEGDVIPFDPVGEAVGSSVRIRIRRPTWDRFRVTVGSGLTGVEGPLPLSVPFSTEVMVSGRLRFAGMTAHHEGTRTAVLVRTNSPLDASAAGPFVDIEPAVLHTFDSHFRGMKILGDFEPGRRYRITLREGLPAGAAGSFPSEIVRTLWIPDRPEGVYFAIEGGVLTPAGPLRVPVRSVNVERAGFRVDRLYPSNVVEYVIEGERSRMGPLGVPVVESEIQFEGDRNEETESYLDLGRIVDGRNGIYAIEIDRGGGGWYRERTVVALTDLGLSARIGVREALVWVTSLESASPVEGAEVTVYSNRRQILGVARSGPDGIATVPLEGTDGPDRPALILARFGEDLSYLNLSRTARGRGEGVVTGRPYLREGYEAFVFPERGVYRPGDDVEAVALVRGIDGSVPDAIPLEFQVLQPSGRILRTRTGTTDTVGRLTATLPVPASAPTGLYRLRCRVPGSEHVLGEALFRVSDYVPRTLRMALASAEGPRPLADPFMVSASVRHLFGEPAAGLSVRCQARFLPVRFVADEWDGYVFGDSREGKVTSRSFEREGTLDPAGEASFAFDVPLMDGADAIEGTVEVEVIERGGRGLAEHLRRRFHPWPWYLGIERPEGVFDPGEIVPLPVAAVCPGGEVATEAGDIRATLYRVTWTNVLQRVDGGRMRYAWTRRETRVDTFVGKLDRGHGTVRFAPEHPGRYRVRVESEGGCRASVEFHVRGNGADWTGEDADRLTLLPDRDRYRPGEMARIAIAAPFAGLALVCIESDRVLESRILDLSGGETEIRIPVRESWRPNVYVTATLIRPVGAEEDWRPHRASGAVRLDVDCSDRRLDVSVEIPDVVRPSRELALDFRVADAEGNGVARAGLVVATVDEGVLALTDHPTPDPWGFFYGPRRLGVVEYDLYGRLAPQLVDWGHGPELLPGGGGEGDADPLAGRLTAVPAARIRTAAFYTGRVVTDADGRARVVFSLPEYVGELRVMAVAAEGARYGRMERALPVRAPLMVRTSWPRFLAPGDRFKVPVTLFNRTGTGGTVSLRLEIEGPLRVSVPIPDRVDLPADGERTVLLDLEATGVGIVRARVAAAIGEESHSDSVELPVRPAAASGHRAGSVRVEGEEPERVLLEGTYLPGTGRASLVVGGSPVVDLSGALAYLLEYPYGCAEQTVSRMVPLLYVRDLAGLSMPGSIGDEEIDELWRSGILRLRILQRHDGGIAAWPGSRSAHPWCSLYAADLLVEAGKAGYEVPRDLLDPLLSHLNRRLEGWVTERDAAGYPSSFGEAAYGAYVLVRAGRPAHAWMGRLERILKEADARGDRIPVTGRFHLAAAALAAGEPGAAAELVADADPTAEVRETDRTFDSPVREAAVMLSVLLDLDPESDRIAALASRLRERLDAGRWGTTQENAFALMALGKYARLTPLPPEGAIVSVVLPDGSRRTFPSRRGGRVDGLEPGRSVTVEVSGAGRVHLFWRTEGVPADGLVEERDAGLRIRRSLLRMDGSEADPGALRQGNLYRIRLLVEADRSIGNLAIADLLPAGFEIEDPDLLGVSRRVGETGLPSRRLGIDAIERRDDRLLLFGSLHGGYGMYEYVVRAVAAGTYVHPAVEVECMYDPALYSVYGRGRIHVISGE